MSIFHQIQIQFLKLLRPKCFTMRPSVLNNNVEMVIRDAQVFQLPISILQGFFHALAFRFATDDVEIIIA